MQITSDIVYSKIETAMAKLDIKLKMQDDEEILKVIKETLSKKTDEDRFFGHIIIERDILWYQINFIVRKNNLSVIEVEVVIMIPDNKFDEHFEPDLHVLSHFNAIDVKFIFQV